MASAEDILAVAIVVGVGVWIARRVIKKQNFQALPKEGPMKVDIKEVYENKLHQLKLNIQISQADWKEINRLGLMDHVLVTTPNHIRPGDDPFVYTIRQIPSTKAMGFRDIIEMRTAKEQIITSLQQLRSQIDGGEAQTESLEI